MPPAGGTAPKFRTLDDADVAGKRVLVRVDLNVPMSKGVVSDLTRITRVIPTIRELSDKGAKVILLAHFGRPKGEPEAKSTLEPLAVALEHEIGRTVSFAEDCIGPVAETAVDAMRNGSILLLENARFHKGETTNDPAFVAALAKLGDIYVNDAFSAAHRAHATTEGLAHVLPAYAGRTMEAELSYLSAALTTPERPLAAIVGGAKISTKLDLLENLVKRVDMLIIGGGMANTFLFAQGKAVGHVAVREGHGRHQPADHGGGQRGRLRDRAAGRWGRRREIRGRRAERGRRRERHSRGQDDARHRAAIDRAD